MTDGVSRIRKFLIHKKPQLFGKKKEGEGGHDHGWKEKRTVGFI